MHGPINIQYKINCPVFSYLVYLLTKDYNNNNNKNNAIITTITFFLVKFSTPLMTRRRWDRPAYFSAL
jgi:hypothetical protein